VPPGNIELDSFTLQCKVNAMEPNWAEENLQVIRTLMERSALYRRAMAPVMAFAGATGAGAAIIAEKGAAAHLGFATYWMLVCFATIGGALFLVRRQAMRDGEPFWSSPTRRVAQALYPPLFVGLVLGLVVLASQSRPEPWPLLAIAWVFLYGLALHAAGFFMVRGIKLLGWIFILSASALSLARLIVPDLDRTSFANAIMGATFGGLHIAYGIYLYFTEKSRNAQ